MKELKVLNPYLFRYKYRFILGFLFLCSANFFLAYAPLFVGKAIDGIKDGLGLIDIYLNIYKGLVCSILSGISMFLVRQTIIVASRKIEYDLKNDIYNHLQALSLSSLRQMNTGDLMSRSTSDLNSVRSYFGPCIMYFFNTSFRLIFAVSAMVSVSGILTVYALLPAPLLAYLVYFIGKHVRKRSQELQEIYGSLTTCAQENLSGIRVIKAFTKENYQVSIFSRINDACFKKNMSLAKLQSWFYPVISFLLGLSILLTLWIGGKLVIDQRITVGMLTQFIIYINALSWPIISIGWITNMFQRAASAQSRINYLFSIKPEIQDAPITTRINIENLSGSIEFSEVSFSYSSHPQKPILKNISFKIEAGEKIAIVGEIGSGKTALLELISRLYEPNSGTILLDNHDIKKIPLRVLRKEIAYVPQDHFLFSTTISNNITFGIPRREISLNELSDIAKSSDIYEDILDFPEKFETVIGERGVTLSGGQKQRLAIARAFIKKSPILILDDSLSAVDAATEETIIQNIFSSYDNITLLVATHRFSIAQQCDKVMVLNKGQIVEMDHHSLLLSDTQSTYAKLYQKQQLEEYIVSL